MKKISDYLYKNFALDLRSIALMRMALALILMIDLIIRSNSLAAHYTDDGVLPLSTLYTSNWNPSFFSVYCISTGWKIIAALFVINFLFALMLFFGYKTRFASVMCWIFIVSLHNRNPIVLQGGDELLRIALFWGIFFPWGKRYSVDNLINIKEHGIQSPEEKNWFDVPALGLMVLVFSVYFFSAVLKTSDEWRAEGSALYYALSLDQMVWPLGKAIYHNPGLLKFLTHFTFFLELIGPLLLFVPVKNPWFRGLFVVLIFLFHIGIALMLFVGLFFLIGMATSLGLIPTGMMDRLENKTGKLRQLCAKPFMFLCSKLAGLLVFKVNLHFKLSETIKYQLKLLRIAVLFFIVCFNVLWCIGLVNGSKLKVNEKFLWFAYMFRFDQNWGMFAPSVYKDDGWYIYEGELENGKLIDLNRDGKEVDYKKPGNILANIQDDRWRKFGEIIQLQSDRVKYSFCRYLEKKWNKEHPNNKVKKVNVVYMIETTLPDYKVADIKRTVICDCD